MGQSTEEREIALPLCGVRMSRKLCYGSELQNNLSVYMHTLLRLVYANIFARGLRAVKDACYNSSVSHSMYVRDTLSTRYMEFNI